LGEPGQLAALVNRYFAEVDAFNARALSDGYTDEEADALADATFEATLRQMIGVPARTTEDALAALDWLIKEGADLESEYGEGDRMFGGVVTSLVDAIRDHIVSGRQA
jgi:glycerol kinase